MNDKKGYNDCFKTLKPVSDTLDVISGKWKLQIIISIGAGNHRFTTIMESIPFISPKVLAKELKELEANQIVKREVSTGYPVTIHYSLEKYADSLTPLIYAMRDWGINHRLKILKDQESSVNK